MDKMIIKLDTIQKLRNFLVILVISIVIVETFTVKQWLFDLNTINLINIFASILSVVLPFLLGYYYNEFKVQKSAIDELYIIISELWKNAEEMESKANNEKFFTENEIMNWGVFYKKECLQKEVSILYILGFYFTNVKWYNHKLYNLPDNFKEKISELCEYNLTLDDIILKYNDISIDEFIRHQLMPLAYHHGTTNKFLKEFFMFLIENSDKNQEYIKIYDELKKN